MAEKDSQNPRGAGVFGFFTVIYPTNYAAAVHTFAREGGPHQEKNASSRFTTSEGLFSDKQKFARFLHVAKSHFMNFCVPKNRALGAKQTYSVLFCGGRCPFES